jgi:hypothetical protein
VPNEEAVTNTWFSERCVAVTKKQDLNQQSDHSDMLLKGPLIDRNSIRQMPERFRHRFKLSR